MTQDSSVQDSTIQDSLIQDGSTNGRREAVAAARIVVIRNGPYELDGSIAERGVVEHRVAIDLYIHHVDYPIVIQVVRRDQHPESLADELLDVENVDESILIDIAE